MPGGDRTGPRGQGPMTGRGLGPCADTGSPGSQGRGRWAGGGRGGAGGGWRHRRWFHATGLPGWQRAQAGWPGMPAVASAGEPQLEALLAKVAELERALGALAARIQGEDGSDDASQA